MYFYYFNLDHNKKNKFSNGEFVNINKLLKNFRLKNRNLIFKNKNIFSELNIEVVNPKMEENKKEWIKMFSTIVFILTGCVPNNSDKKYFKNIYTKLKQYSHDSYTVKKLINSKRFIFGCLPYIVSGFLVKNISWSLNGNNNFKNFFSFLENLNKKDSSISTFFCAHREKLPELVEKLDYRSISISCNLILGIVKNINEKFMEREKILTIYQPDGSVFGVSSVFPEIFLNYMKTRRLGELVVRIDNHFNNLQKLRN